MRIKKPCNTYGGVHQPLTVLLHLKWYIVPGLVSGYYLFTLVQQKVQLLHPKSNEKMLNYVSTC